MIGKRLEQLRKTKVISQRQLASHIGVASTTISRYERDLFTPSEEVLTRLADFFQVDVGVFSQPVANSIASICYVPHSNHPLPMKVRHKLEADLQMQIESWEAIEPRLATGVSENKLDQRNRLVEIAKSAEIEELASRAVETWLSIDDKTRNLTRFIEWLGLRILITDEIDSRFEGLEASSDQRSYLLVSTRWSDEKYRCYLAKMLGNHILGNHSTIERTVENLESFATKFLQQVTTNFSTTAPYRKYPEIPEQ